MARRNLSYAAMSGQHRPRFWIKTGVKSRRGEAGQKSFSGWTKTFTDPRLCAAIVDRLTFGGNLIQTGTESYRLALTQARAAAHDASG
jgi:IstB-like ATP binding protein